MTNRSIAAGRSRSRIPARGSACRSANARILFEACGNSSVGRAQPCQGWGRGFESRFPLCACSPFARERPRPLPSLLRNDAGDVDGAGMAKSVDARDLKSLEGNLIRVRSPVPALGDQIHAPRRAASLPDHGMRELSGRGLGATRSGGAGTERPLASVCEDIESPGTARGAEFESTRWRARRIRRTGAWAF